MGVIPSEDAWERTARTVRRDEQRYADPTKLGGRRLRIGGECSPRNEVWQIKLDPSTTAGTFDVDVTVNGSQETLTFNWDDTAAEVKTELATHTELTSDDIDTSGGPFPDVTINIEFQGDYAKTLMFDSASNAPVIDDGSLTGSVAYFNALIPGHPKNANPA